jgi:hypothetical protein
MKTTLVYGFTTEEIEALSKAGKILGELSAVFNEPSDTERALDETTKGLIAALKDVLGRF